MMYRFYMKGAQSFPIELTNEQVLAGKLIPLSNGDLIRVDSEGDDLKLTVAYATEATGVIYGVEKDGLWIDQAIITSQGTRNPTGASGDWVNGLTEAEAALHENASSALVVGQMSEEVVLTFRSYGESEEIRCMLRLEPETMTLKKGELGSFYVYDGILEGATQTFEVGDGAVILEQTNSKITVGASKAGTLVTITLNREYESGRVCVGSATLIIEGEEIITETEKPAPAEPFEPPVLIGEEKTFEEAFEVTESVSVLEPFYRTVTHRYRGMRESHKLSEHIAKGKLDIDIINEKADVVENKIRILQENYGKGQAVAGKVTVEKTKQWTIEKKPYQQFIKLPCFGCDKIVSKTIKLNSKLLDVPEVEIKDYGILVLTGKALQSGGKLEVEATWIETIDNGTYMGAPSLMDQGQNILRDVHRIIGGE